MPLRATVIPVTAFQQNCSVIWCTATMDGAVIDPGGDLPHILNAVADEGINLTKILLTHAHIDHAGGTHALAKQLGLPIEGPHPDDQFWIDMLPEQARMFGFEPVSAFAPDRWLAQGDTVTVGEEPLEVYHCPGHTPGHVIFFSRASQLAFVGDVLFAGSIGRTDFPRGDLPTLIRSITSNLWPLGNDVTFIPGHGPTSTFGQERASNPFVSDRALRP
ncbi:MAG: MBL fold metallo-hydrolase [Gammaproteobacteria bacterium]